MINDYLVRWSTANPNNVTTQLTHYKTNSFAIQNQASHVIFNSGSPEGRAAGAPTRRSLAKAQPYGTLAYLWRVGRESGLINGTTQSGWRMIV
jgi:hypothetical protein